MSDAAFDDARAMIEALTPSYPVYCLRPEVLAAKAREVIHGAGYEDPPADSVYTFFENGSYMRHLMDLDRDVFAEDLHGLAKAVARDAAADRIEPRDQIIDLLTERFGVESREEIL